MKGADRLQYVVDNAQGLLTLAYLLDQTTNVICIAFTGIYRLISKLNSNLSIEFLDPLKSGYMTRKADQLNFSKIVEKINEQDRG